jgi:TRAP-type mannitol/chloroaromatic compound transport system permease small subunit
MTTAHPEVAGGGQVGQPDFEASGSGSTVLIRMFAWGMLGLLVAFLLNNYLTFWQGMPGAWAVFYGDFSLAAIGQLAISVAIVGYSLVHVLRTADAPLRPDSVRIHGYNEFFIRAAFWAVLLIGVVDTAISFLRVEGLMDVIFGHQFASDVGRSQFRAPYIHMPLIGIGIILAMVTRTLGFTWLSLLVVLAELIIVIGRYVFSYEQAFMADLVRFWYAALFLFASAYTLFEDGHVRVDILYAAFRDRTKGVVNGIGSVVLGISLCWVILFVGMWGPNNIINSPILSFEVTQSGFGMYVKYLMAAFIGVFAISMMIQFISYLLESAADVRGEPGKREIATVDIAH